MELTPYSTISPLIESGLYTPWITDELEKQRVASYLMYEAIYWNVPDTFRLMLRGKVDSPIYVPTAKTIVEVTNRYTAGKLRPFFHGTGADAATQAFTSLLERERWGAIYGANKRYGTIRGDWLWYLNADPKKPAGKRISIRSLDPGQYFPIWDDDDPERIVGCHIVTQFTDSTGQLKLRRETYRKTDDGFVSRELGIFKTDDWGGPTAKPEKVIVPVTKLPITALPVYHMKNVEEPGNPFGSSELRGFERILAGLHQGISDEELALALVGLGVWATDAESPTDDEGNDLPWYVSPGRVIEIQPGTSFSRVPGITDVEPMQDHLKFLIDQLLSASATPDVAIGNVTSADSGIALALKFSPLLAKVDEKDDSIISTHNQMWWDLMNVWFPAYEGMHFDQGITLGSRVSEKLPIDRETRTKELDNMLDRDVISRQYYRDEMIKLGYAFPDDIDDQIAADQETDREAVDPYAVRAGQEM